MSMNNWQMGLPNKASGTSINVKMNFNKSNNVIHVPQLTNVGNMKDRSIDIKMNDNKGHNQKMDMSESDHSINTRIEINSRSGSVDDYDVIIYDGGDVFGYGY